DALGQKIVNELKEPGTYLITAGTTWTAASTTLNRGEARRLAGQAFDDNGRNLDAALGQFIGAVAAADNGEPASQSGDGGGGGGVGIGTIAVLTALVVGGGGVLFRGRRRRKEREAERQRGLGEGKWGGTEDLGGL